ncbi:transcription termination/antitermination protein NusG [Helcococcus massiliensis]|uniref:transcription termination/antitermination protein NusG n=1 Tax=Helcococcus massiliensis TaxID=2040290 RepID=UPI000CDED2CD|nr:transcription termination/antitermination protein NusG [Helcococcus massiliensis]
MDNENIEQANWYVVHTYSGHENKVKSKIENMIENGSSHNIFDVRVPMEEYEDIVRGEKKIKERKVFPGYVLIKMIVDSRNWYLVRNTRGVTGFIGPDGDPVPLSPKEIKDFGIESEDPISVKLNAEDLGINIGDSVELTEGNFKGYMATVVEINYEKQTINATIDFLGRETAAEVPFDYFK